jgi:hypothetical protein
VGGAPINGSGLTSDIGYGFVQAPGNATALTITPRPISVQASNQSRAYGDPNPATGPYTITAGTLVGTDAIGSVNVTSPATATSPAGSVWVLTNTGANFSSGAATNYTITLQNGQLAISPAPLTITANDAARRFGEPNPPFTATATGFKLGQSIANLNGALAITTPATVLSPSGSYPIVPSGVSSPNYTITFVDGRLVVGQGIPPADQALITATQRSADSEDELAARAPGAERLDCLEIERAGVRRVLARCF